MFQVSFESVQDVVAFICKVGSVSKAQDFFPHFSVTGQDYWSKAVQKIEKALSNNWEFRIEDINRGDYDSETVITINPEHGFDLDKGVSVKSIGSCGGLNINSLEDKEAFVRVMGTIKPEKILQMMDAISEYKRIRQALNA